MERIVNKTKSFAAADEWDIRQHVELSPRERRRIARELKRRIYGTKCPDVRACHSTEAVGRPKDLDDLRYLRQAATSLQP